MRWLTILLKPFKVDEVMEALAAAHPEAVESVTIEEVRGYGRQKGHLELYRGSEYEITFLPKVKVHLAAEDGAVADIIRIVLETARTGRIGDGKVFVQEVRAAWPF